MEYTSLPQALEALEKLQSTLFAYNHAMGILSQDASTAAPEGSWEARGKTMEVLTRVCYDLTADPRNGILYDYLSAHASELTPIQARELEVLKKNYDRMRRIPAREYVDYSVLLNEADAVWHRAKPANDFAAFAPYLEKIVAYCRKFAGYYNPDMAPYDALLNEYEEGMNQETLDIIGRRHTVEQTKEAFHLARELGYDNINMDLIVGLPGEDIHMVERTLEQVRELAPDSITVHSLAVKRAARLNIFKEKYQEMSFENNQEIMDLTMKTAYEMGMGPYYLYRQKNMKGNFENVGYAKVDKAGIYNILIMEEKQPIIALGAGGSSKLVFDHGKRIERVENVKDVTSYIARIDEMIERKRTGIGTWL